MDDEAVWKQRFLKLTLARLAALALFLLGMAVTFTGLVREGGSPQVGAVLVIIGAVGSVLAPKLVRKSWERE